ncbi:MAG: glycoside hydrolase family 97 catalytic domain-containing protein [Bacteroidales bacterium]|nr:glycoside hydrolase family 97 catalytic domain-containing protein [Bacteroidales bacterium]
MTRTLIILSILIGINCAAYSQPIKSVKSPDGKNTLTISKVNDTTLTFSVSRLQKTYIDSAYVFISFSDSPHNAISPIFLTNTKQTSRRDTMRSAVWERAIQPDYYNELSITFQNGKNTNTLKIRMYNEGFATGIEISNPEKQKVTDYHTTYHWTNPGIFHIFDHSTEKGYNSIMGKDKVSALSPMLTLSTTDTLIAFTHEAANYEFFSRARTSADNFSVTISQYGLYQIGNYSTPWHFVVFADNPNDFIEGKYIVRSLTLKPNANYNWVKPGKVFRHPGNKDSDFSTAEIKKSIDFAAQMKFQYVLLDNGWYGMGYDNEFDQNSDPMQTVQPLDLPETVRYAKQKGIGILLYFNKTAFSTHSSDSVLTHYSKIGIKGVKLGFFKNGIPMDNVLASRIITKCASLGMVVNVHDEYRPTGVERLYPNFLTCEGLRGNEHLDNSGNHTTLLPFIRYMAGAGDYTICYDAATSSRLDMKTTKAHQLALSIILFSPLQHIFWYGSPEWYSNQMEIELFKEIPTVWDDYKMIGGFPRRLFSIARRKGNTWYVATIAGTTKSEIEFPLSKLTKKNCTITHYQDTGDASIGKTIFKATPSDTLKISLRPDSGSVMVITPDSK